MPVGATATDLLSAFLLLRRKQPAPAKTNCTPRKNPVGAVAALAKWMNSSAVAIIIAGFILVIAVCFSARSRARRTLNVGEIVELTKKIHQQTGVNPMKPTAIIVESTDHRN